MKQILILLALCMHFFCAKAQSPFLDSSFATYGRQTFAGLGSKTITAIAIDTNGNIYTGGHFTMNSNNNISGILTKSSSSGIADNTFGVQGVVQANFDPINQDYFSCIAITNDQKVMAAGYSTNTDSMRQLLARYTANGVLDSSFGTNGFVIARVGAYSRITSVAIQNDNKIVVAGLFRISTYTGCLVARYNTNGTLDATFGTNGIDTFRYNTLFNDSVISVKIQPGGKIVIGVANATYGKIMLARFNVNGTIDSTFGVNGVRTLTNQFYFAAMTLLPDGSIIIANHINASGGSKAYVKKITPNGAFDSTFTNLTGNNITSGVRINFNDPNNETYIYALSVANDGGIIAAGSFIPSSAGHRPAFIKLQPNGSIDSTVGINGVIGEGIITEIKAVAIQRDNKIVAGLDYAGYQIYRYTNIPLFLGNDKIICQGNSITLNAGNPGSTYLWSTGATTQTISVTDSGNYAVRVTNSLGSVTDTIHIAYYPQPIVNLGNDTTFCSGNTLTLSAQNSGATYLWSTAVTTQTIDVTTTGIYSVAVTNAYQCVSKDTIQVTVNTSPVIVNLGNDTAFCTGNTLILNAGNTGSTYIWSNAASSQTIDVATSGIYAVVVTDMNQCKGSDTITVNVNPLPVVNLGNDTTFCAGNILDAQNAGMSFLWNTNATTQTITVNNSGTYSVTVTDANQCSSSDTIHVITNPLPIVNLGNDTTAGNGNIITLNAGNEGDTYLWNTGATSQTINVINSGTYSVVVTNSNGCTGTDSIVISFGIVGIHSVAGNNYQWSISPNPTRYFINVNINDLKLLNTMVTITDIYGRIVKMITLKNKSQTISLDALVNGLYILKMQNGESMKFVKD